MTTVFFIIIHGLYFVWFMGRRFDLFTLVFLTSTIYFLPAFFGFTHDGTLPKFHNAIGSTQYAFYYFYFTLLTSTAWIFGKTKPALISASTTTTPKYLAKDMCLLTTMTRLLRFITPLLLALAWFAMGANLLAIDKQIVLDNFSIFYVLFQITTLIYLICSALVRKRIDFLFGIFYLLFDLLVGFRAIAAFGLLCLGSHALFQKSTIKRNTIFAFVLIFAYIVGSIYKIAVQAYWAADTTALLSLLDIDTFFDALAQTESFTQQEVFRAIIASRMSIPLDHNMEIFKVFLPGISNLLFGKGTGFNDYFQATLFPHISWGMGSCIWAEQYAIWGWFGPIFMLLVLISILYYLNVKSFQWTASGSVLKLSLLLLLAAPFYFYMHRNDIAFQLATTRNLFLVWVLVYGVTKYISAPFARSLKRGA